MTDVPPPRAEPVDGGAPADPTMVAEPDEVVSDLSVGEAGESAIDLSMPPIEISEEALVALIAERDEYLDALQRLKADFANARRRSDEQAAEMRRQAATDLVNKLLPVLDSAQAALDQGVEQVRPLTDALIDALASQGLARLDPVGEAFDPEMHEAVMFEPGEGEQVVVETMRLGYSWNDRVLRAAMVKVRG